MSAGRVAAREAAGARRIEAGIRAAIAGDRPALAAFLTAGFPARAGFADVVRRVAGAADVIELGVPFSDPMADGVTIQEASRTALADGVTLDWIFELVAGLDVDIPIVLMSYLNPLLTRSHAQLASDASAAGVDGFIVPDLPYEESGPLREALAADALGLVQLVTPLTPSPRRRLLAEAGAGFLYAVTRSGTTGHGGALAPGGSGPGGSDRGGTAEYLGELRRLSPLPVLAGFGIRSPGQVRRLAHLVDGFVVGSALIERLARGEDPAELLLELRRVTPMENA